MRNLKRVLSLALALVMMLSLMIVGAGAAEAKKVDFTDADEIGYNEAVDVMVALEVIQGTDTGAFNPKGVLTREAAAKIICYMLLGADNAENLTTNTQIFTDVAAGRWSAGYIAYCANLGILAGTGDGSFNPEGQLTGVAFGKMLLVALGYRADIEGYVGANWATAIASDMVDAGIAVNGVVLSNPLTREQAAQMAFQTLTADMVRYSQEPVTVTTAEGVSVIVNAPAAEHVYAVSGQNYNSAPTGSHDAVYQQYCEKYYNRLALTAGEDDFDRPAATWKYNGKVIGSYMETPDLTYTKAVKLSDIYKDLSLNKTVAADQVEFSRNGKDETVAAKITDNSGTPVNLDTLGLSKATGNKIGGKGVLTQVWWDNDDEVATITMIDTYMGKVASVVKATGSADRYVTVGSTTSYGSLTTLNNKFETEKFDTDDLVIFTAAYNGSKYDVKTMEALELSATAVLTRWEGSSVATSDKGTSESKFTAGETYEYSQNSLVVDKEGVSSTISAFKVNESEVNVYLDKYGYAIYVSGVEGETNYAAVIGIGSSNTHGSETKGVTLLLPDGTKQTVTAKMDDWSKMTLMHDNDPNQKKLTHVFVREFETPAAATYALSYAAPSGISGLTVVDSASGSGIANGSEINSGITVRVTATVEGGKKATVKVNGTTVGTITGTGDVTFSMPAQASTITFVLTNANAYNGTLKFDTSTPSTTTVEWTSNETPAVAPTYDELYSALLAEIIGQGYDKEGLEDSSNGTNPSFKATKRNGINIASGQQPTFTLTVSSGLTQVVAASTQAELDAALAGSANRIKLTGNAEIDAVPAKPIEVASGVELTVKGDRALTQDITGAGKVITTGDVTAAQHIKTTGGIVVAGTKTLTAGAAWALAGDVTGAGKIDGASYAITNGAHIKNNAGLTLSTGSVDTLSNVPLEVTGTASSLTTGRVAPNTLTFGASGAVTLNSADAELVVPASATLGAVTVTDGKLTLAGNATVAAGKTITIAANKAIDFANHTLAGTDSTSVVTIGNTVTVTGFDASEQNFYSTKASPVKLTTDNEIAAATYKWKGDSAGSTEGWVDQA